MSDFGDRAINGIRFHPLYRPASLALFALTTVAAPFVAGFQITRHLIERRHRRCADPSPKIR